MFEPKSVKKKAQLYYQFLLWMNEITIYIPRVALMSLMTIYE